MRAQASQNKDYINAMIGSKTLEINPHHPVVRDLLAKVTTDAKDTAALQTAQVLFQVAMLDSGYDIRDPSVLVDTMYALMSRSLGVDPQAEWEDMEVEIDEKEEESAVDEDVEEVDEVIDEAAEEAVEEVAAEEDTEEDTEESAAEGKEKEEL